MDKMKYNPLTGQMEMSDVTTADISVTGEAPLSINENYWPREWYKDGIPYIPAGQSLDSILMELFSRTENGQVVWSFQRDEKLISSKIDYTPIVECHGGRWSWVSDKSVSVIPLLKAELSHPYGYFLSPDGQWCNAPLTVDITGSCSKTLVYKINGNTSTRDAGNYRDYRFDNDFGMVYAISEEATVHPLIPGGEYHAPIYASTNKKRIALDVSTHLKFDPTPLPDRGIIVTKKIHGSYYYFAGIVQDNFESILHSDIRNLPIKDFLHQYDKDNDVVYLPQKINLPEMTIHPGQASVIALPPTCGCTYVGDVDKLEYDRSMLPYTLPNGTEVEYRCLYFKNNTETPLVITFTIAT